MDMFFLFGTAGFVTIMLVILEIRFLMRRKDARSLFSRIKSDLIFASFLGYASSAYIFLIEGESGFIDPRESTLDVLRTGLPIYLFIFLFFVTIPTIVYISRYENKNQTKTKPKKRKK